MRPRDFRALSDRLAHAAAVDSRHERERDHIRAVRQQFDAIERGDLDAVLSSAHDNVQLDIYAPPEFHWTRHAKGLVEVRKAIADNFGTVDDQHPEILNVVTEGDSVVLIGHETGSIRATREAYDVQFVHRFTFRDGRLAAVQIVAARS